MDNAEWSANVAMVVDGVLRAPNDNAAIMSGALLYHSLVKSHRLTLIIDSMAKEKVQYWLRMNGFVDHAGEVYYEVEDPEDTVARRKQQIQKIRQHGGLSFVVESETDVAEMFYGMGIPCMLYVHPKYMKPEHRPGWEATVTPWNSLVDTVRKEREQRAMDVRLNDNF
jgi:hypothetical protein